MCVVIQAETVPAMSPETGTAMATSEMMRAQSRLDNYRVK